MRSSDGQTVLDLKLAATARLHSSLTRDAEVAPGPTATVQPVEPCRRPARTSGEHASRPTRANAPSRRVRTPICTRISRTCLASRTGRPSIEMLVSGSSSTTRSTAAQICVPTRRRIRRYEHEQSTHRRPSRRSARVVMDPLPLAEMVDANNKVRPREYSATFSGTCGSAAGGSVSVAGRSRRRNALPEQFTPMGECGEALADLVRTPAHMLAWRARPDRRRQSAYDDEIRPALWPPRGRFQHADGDPSNGR